MFVVDIIYVRTREHGQMMKKVNFNSASSFEPGNAAA